MYASLRQTTGEGANGEPRSNHQSPVQSHAYTPIDRQGRQRSTSNTGYAPSPQQYRSQPASPTASRLPPPPSPSTSRPTTGYYDPMRDTGDRDALNERPYQPRSPAQSRAIIDSAASSVYQNGHQDYPRPTLSRQPSQSSPQQSSHAHPASGMSSNGIRSPISRDQGSRMNGTGVNNTSQDTPAPARPVRLTNPMAMMNLLSDSSAPAAPSTPPTSNAKQANRKPSRTSSTSHPRIKEETEAAAPPAEEFGAEQAARSKTDEAKKMNAYYPPPVASAPPPRPPLPPPTGPPGLKVRDTEAAYAEIEARDLSDVEIEVQGMEAPKLEWQQRTLKRSLEIKMTEEQKRKRRRVHIVAKYTRTFSDAAEAQRDLFIEQHAADAEEEVKRQEIEDDKERKKDMQRKRRREKTLADEKAKRDEAEKKLALINDEDEKARVEKDLQKHTRKIRNTEDLLQGVTPSKDFRAESPRGVQTHTQDGFVFSSFQATDEATPDSGRGRRGKPGYRQRKSKEQKQAEKDRAANGQTLYEQGQDFPIIAPKEEERLQSMARESSEPHESTPFEIHTSSAQAYSSKGYNQIYEQIWKELSKSVPKVVRIKNNSIDTKQSNARKTAQLAAKEARRWQARTNKSTKDVQARAKRSMREMLSFWKRNERDERDQRKVAERQELDKAKKAEADREANRQKRKLNFLISQTELYSHFIGKKVKTDEIERHGEDGGVVPSGQTTVEKPGAHPIDLPESVGKLGTKVTNFEDLDFDAEDETTLRQAAMANAQNAVQEAQDRARAFNNPDGEEEGRDMKAVQGEFDDGEMNFQNPTSLQNMDVSQPKLLNCQLKEYQLKGLNWLVNLYEQGINGILADEMGLGKTVQSISVMAYLAEVHNIWGPFLVIAPASTLHNWQQEIARFVPAIKVLPYWGSAKDRKVLRKFWDRKHITYNKDSSFHVLVTSYQLVVQDTAYFQKIKWQYMILDEAQAIKSSSSSRWKALLGFHCRNRLLLTGTPIQNNMQELWALLHFIMPSLFDSHDEFSEWFSKDIENHAQSNTKLNEDQLRRLHMILKPFMLRRIKKHVQKELGDKIEEDVFCDLTYRQRAYYTNLRNKISIMDLIEKAAVGDDQDTATLMNLVMQFRKVCNHPDLFERAEITSPMSCSSWAETASFMREGHNINVSYSVRNLIEYWLPRRLGEGDGRLDTPGLDNPSAGWKKKWLNNELSIWNPKHIQESEKENGAFSWLRFVDQSAGDVATTARKHLIERSMDLAKNPDYQSRLSVTYDDDEESTGFTPARSMLNIVKRNSRKPLAEITNEGHLQNLMNISSREVDETGYGVIEACYLPAVSAPPVELVCQSQHVLTEKETTFFNVPLRRALYPISTATEYALLNAKVAASSFSLTNMLPPPASQKQRFTQIQVPSMRRFVTDSGKLAQLDRLLRRLKEGGHRVLLYFQMTRMIDLMEEYLTYRNFKYCRLDGSTKLEDRRDTVAAFQSSPDLFVFLLSTRAGGLGINLTAADTVIFYDSDWNPTIDSQAMDRAHRLGQTRQVTVYRLITRGTIEERIRKRALQKEEVQRVVISGGAPAGGDKVIDFNARSRENNRTKDIAMWLADDDQAEAIEKKEAEIAEAEARDGGKGKKRKAAGKRKEVSMDDMYHEGEGKFDDASHEPSGAATPVSTIDGPPTKKRKGTSKKAKTLKQRLAVVDGEVG